MQESAETIEPEAADPAIAEAAKGFFDDEPEADEGELQEGEVVQEAESVTDEDDSSNEGEKSELDETAEKLAKAAQLSDEEAQREANRALDEMGTPTIDSPPREPRKEYKQQELVEGAQQDWDDRCSYMEPTTYTLKVVAQLKGEDGMTEPQTVPILSKKGCPKHLVADLIDRSTGSTYLLRRIEGICGDQCTKEKQQQQFTFSNPLTREQAEPDPKAIEFMTQSVDSLLADRLELFDALRTFEEDDQGATGIRAKLEHAEGLLRLALKAFPYIVDEFEPGSFDFANETEEPVSETIEESDGIPADGIEPDEVFEDEIAGSEEEEAQEDE